MTTRKKTDPTSLAVHLDLAQAEQFRNLCTILHEEPIDLARKLFLDALQKETLQVLKSMARRSPRPTRQQPDNSAEVKVVDTNIEALAKKVAEHANTCCNRDDGFEEDVFRVARNAIAEALTGGQSDNSAKGEPVPQHKHNGEQDGNN